jgi:hypothetical protein
MNRTFCQVEGNHPAWTLPKISRPRTKEPHPAAHILLSKLKLGSECNSMRRQFRRAVDLDFDN